MGNFNDSPDGFHSDLSLPVVYCNAILRFAQDDNIPLAGQGVKGGGQSEPADRTKAYARRPSLPRPKPTVIPTEPLQKSNVSLYVKKRQRRNLVIGCDDGLNG